MKLLLLVNFVIPTSILAHGGAHHDHSSGFINADADITDHDLEHLKSAIDLKKPIKDMTKDERQFYYFKQADTNDDDHLDGLEMLQTMIKFEMEDAEYNGEQFKVMRIMSGLISWIGRWRCRI